MRGRNGEGEIGRKTKDKRQKTKDKRQKTKDKRNKTARSHECKK